jgi:hypothetical protein
MNLTINSPELQYQYNMVNLTGLSLEQVKNL